MLTVKEYRGNHIEDCQGAGEGYYIITHFLNLTHVVVKYVEMESRKCDKIQIKIIFQELNSNSFQPGVRDLRYFKLMNTMGPRSQSLKYQMFKPSGCKYKGI